MSDLISRKAGRMMKNEIEIWAYITIKDGIRIEVAENIWYGEETMMSRSHGFRCQGEIGHPVKIRISIDQYFDFIANMIPEKFRTERIQKWLESKNNNVRYER